MEGIEVEKMEGGGATNESAKTKANVYNFKVLFCFSFKKRILEVTFLGSLIPLFRTIGDVSSDFISGGSNFGANGSSIQAYKWT